MYNFDIELDINSEIFPMKKGELYSLKLTDTISEDTMSDKDFYSVIDSDSLFVKEHDYIMYGKVFKYIIDPT